MFLPTNVFFPTNDGRIRSLESELTRLRNQLASESRIKASTSERKCRIQKTMSLTHSASILQMKERELDRVESELARHERHIADIQRTIAQKERALAEARQQKDRDDAQRQQQQQQDNDLRAKLQNEEIEKIRIQLAEQIQENERLNEALAQIQRPPEELVVLFLASNPDTEHHLKLDEEARAIQEKIRMAEFRDAIRFVSRWAVRPLDVLQAINETNPVAIHFSGHGFETGELVFTDQNGAPKAVTAEAISSVVAASSERIQLFFFNACFSEEQAKAVTKHVDAAIGMTDSIGDEAARVFAAAFYSAVGFGKSVQESFAQARAALLLEGIPEENTPRLFVKEGVDANQIVLVKKTQKGEKHD